MNILGEDDKRKAEVVLGNTCAASRPHSLKDQKVVVLFVYFKAQSRYFLCIIYIYKKF